MGLTAKQREFLRAEVDRRARDRAKGPAPAAPALLTDLRLVVALAGLTMDEREAWFDRVVLGDHLPRIAARMGVSRTTVRTLEKRAQDKLALGLPRDHPMVVEHLGVGEDDRCAA